MFFFSLFLFGNFNFLSFGTDLYLIHLYIYIFYFKFDSSKKKLKNVEIERNKYAKEVEQLKGTLDDNDALLKTQASELHGMKVGH